MEARLTERSDRDRARAALRLLLAALFAAAGVLHLAAPHPFLSITPAWVPFAPAVVALTGLCELAGAAGLVTPRWRRPAAALLAAYAVCVYPANVEHALLHAERGAPPGWWYHGPRLALQPVIIWACLFAGGLIDRPFGRRG